MIRGLAHVAIAVEDLQEALSFYRDALGLAFEGTEEVPEQGVRVAFLRAGALRLELLEPLAEDSPMGRFLAKRGPGLHHLALETCELEADLARLEEAGARLVDSSPRKGAEGSRVAFIHPSATGGVLLELVERVG